MDASDGGRDGLAEHGVPPVLEGRIRKGEAEIGVQRRKVRRGIDLPAFMGLIRSAVVEALSERRGGDARELGPARHHAPEVDRDQHVAEVVDERPDAARVYSSERHMYHVPTERHGAHAAPMRRMRSLVSARPLL